jgi:hypothetical protein
MSDALLDLADGVAEALAEALPSVSIDGVDRPVTTLWADDPRIDLADEEIADPLVWVVDWGESMGADGALKYEEYALLVIVQMKLAASQNRETFLRALSAFVATLTRTLRPLDAECVVNGAVCVRTQRQPGRNLADWHAQGRYYVEILTTWRAY